MNCSRTSFRSCPFPCVFPCSFFLWVSMFFQIFFNKLNDAWNWNSVFLFLLGLRAVYDFFSPLLPRFVSFRFLGSFIASFFFSFIFCLLALFYSIVPPNRTEVLRDAPWIFRYICSWHKNIYHGGIVMVISELMETVRIVLCSVLIYCLNVVFWCALCYGTGPTYLCLSVIC